MPLGVDVTRADSRGDLLGDSHRELHRLHDRREQRRQLFFTDVAVFAVAVEVGAVVVDVLALLPLRGDRAPTEGTRQEAHEGVALRRIPCPRLPPKGSLDLVE